MGVTLAHLLISPASYTSSSSSSPSPCSTSSHTLLLTLFRPPHYPNYHNSHWFVRPLQCLRNIHILLFSLSRSWPVSGVHKVRHMEPRGPPVKEASPALSVINVSSPYYRQDITPLSLLCFMCTVSGHVVCVFVVIC